MYTPIYLGTPALCTCIWQLELVSQWLGHSQLETSLIYARATTDMKRKAVDKISAKENSVFKSDEKFKYADNEDVIRQLYGLM
mgnify:CR=1 FL=1